MTTLYRPKQTPSVIDPLELKFTLLTIGYFGASQNGSAELQKQKAIQAAQDRQLKNVYKQMQEQKNKKDLPRHAKHEAQPVAAHSKRWR